MFTSAVNTLLASNDVPSPSEATNLLEEIHKASSDISSLAAEIAGLQRKKEAMEEVLNKMKAVFHPARRTPAEIWALIFRFCVAGDVRTEEIMTDVKLLYDRQHPPPTLDTTKAPWVQCRVSAGWRTVALSTPELWTTLEVHYCDSSRYWQMASADCRSPVSRLLQLRHERAQCQPLSMSLNLKPYKGVPPFLRSNVSQWVDLAIRATYAEDLSCLAFCKDNLSNLSTLHLHFNGHSPGDNSSFRGTFRNTPKLRHLTLSGNLEFKSLLTLQLPWSQITHFITKNLTQPVRRPSNTSIQLQFLPIPSTNIYFQILPHLKNVQECSLHVVPFHEEPHTSRSFVLPHLQHLVFTEGTLADITTQFNYLELPGLRSFDFNLKYALLRQTIDCTIRRSNQLEELSIDGTGLEVDPDELVKFLRLPLFKNVCRVDVTGVDEIRSTTKRNRVRHSKAAERDLVEALWEMGKATKLRDFNLRGCDGRVWGWSELSTRWGWGWTSESLRKKLKEEVGQ